jgi:hypothetical protein
MDKETDRARRVIAATQRWLEAAVIGLNLCPFAAGVASAGRIRYRVSEARSTDELRHDLAEELRALAAADPAQVETTLLIHPQVLQDFLDFNDFLDDADAVVEVLGLAGTLQLASFHPGYQFAGTTAADVGNCTNRSPYPTLHLLREASVGRAVATLREPSVIYERNIATMNRLGHAGWARLGARFAPDSEAGNDLDPEP